jgi:hypothetical protein
MCLLRKTKKQIELSFLINNLLKVHGAHLHSLGQTDRQKNTYYQEQGDHCWQDNKRKEKKKTCDSVEGGMSAMKQSCCIRPFQIVIVTFTSDEQLQAC